MKWLWMAGGIAAACLLTAAMAIPGPVWHRDQLWLLGLAAACLIGLSVVAGIHVKRSSPWWVSGPSILVGFWYALRQPEIQAVAFASVILALAAAGIHLLIRPRRTA